MTAFLAPIQSASKFGSAGLTTDSLAFTSNVKIGSLLVVAGAADNGSRTINTPTDTQGNVWTLLGQFLGAASHTQYLAFAQASASGACTVSVSANGTTTWEIEIGEFSGAPNGAIQLGAVQTANGSGTTSNAPTMISSAPTSLVLNHVYFSGSFTSLGGAWKQMAGANGSVAAYQSAGQGSYASNATGSAATAWWSLGAVLSIVDTAMTPQRQPLGV